MAYKMLVKAGLGRHSLFFDYAEFQNTNFFPECRHNKRIPLVEVIAFLPVSGTLVFDPVVRDAKLKNPVLKNVALERTALPCKECGFLLPSAERNKKNKEKRVEWPG
ncbi:hypothetical protein NPIL_564521 [Nephila pilipes]|uniref:Uncharacterized protein n=1 Tax=Nephila pilipes TaxID=299642 RepID=A0A8X6PQF7_NEPPI|nr:hypothetical protein NPIL_564521 [Nephila pilipes]